MDQRILSFSTPYSRVRGIMLEVLTMATATLTSKGQITIPVQVRTALGLETGDRVEFVEMEDGKFSMIAASKTVKDLKGLINTPARPVSIEDMNQAIAARGAKAR
ncbi:MULTISPECIES: AbrB/MazE/SpoVT family DNA-binding domain-containing protein [Pseudomonas]|uniref:AbrB/MazE/SpoVT family DNA-binding domain-containing protein n=1 Tax=Pseudomonas TaxID=286 RepID=UPI001AE19183|nr:MULTISPECIES: AbrB/MazE/SpoVT family DNA-binding domain-containing protein [unclassified Pseudomonas]MEB0105889.1 AbrB/MazE/SpoVT family DNA-binding domain-containing protein [Pseudomonas sp. MH9.3]WPX79259.1 AbrB/MazE/SpoVT family DNA-binding domain-containing protein [Pseudomonas sp. MH9.3]WQG58511.1 AbrB/MazE/SpoVT family DNA-binding domain-containing protein [Pseudomonas sp. RTB3]